VFVVAFGLLVVRTSPSESVDASVFGFVSITALNLNNSSTPDDVGILTRGPASQAHLVPDFPLTVTPKPHTSLAIRTAIHHRQPSQQESKTRENTMTRPIPGTAPGSTGASVDAPTRGSPVIGSFTRTPGDLPAGRRRIGAVQPAQRGRSATGFRSTPRTSQPGNGNKLLRGSFRSLPSLISK
jgi:hypothetical protein